MANIEYVWISTAARTVREYVEATPSTGATVPTTGQIWPRGGRGN